ncbi:dTDP-4-dehydrorhamnose 3,5-epimerase [Cetobacterium ceti]|uniref:dTDP-4-dehydrorhamnose 3,5-epimerase n=1 Tax=Cetobacterium ceti TaxID=180163 RepID=A0A1T4LT73_9FUSO|nr:dTDP-4-dehydrorhamnose 3,5-epimerase [Cetobacterium ceti]SJZ57930.1 dTDP-4-dehydrorhamnose 3,5-epimerase [Cetobacterium ceti]
MEFIKTDIEGVFIIENKIFKDERGQFIKTFNSEIFKNNGIDISFLESYYSISNKDVIRGMHFQLPPEDHSKLVYVIKGSVLDVVLDLRRNSKTFGKSIFVNLSEENKRSLYIPKGLAHGFKSLEDNTVMVYNVSTGYDNKSDYGILWNSFGFDWKIENPILSKRDKEFETFNEFFKKEIF